MLGARRYRLTELLDVREGQPMKSQFEACTNRRIMFRRRCYQRRGQIMMGRQSGDQSRLFYLFNLERRIPTGHLLRRINPVVTLILGELREKLAPF